jgi:chromosome segregation ATPase
MERQEQARALDELRGELGALRDQLQQKQANVQQATDAALAAKDGIIAQLQRELQDLRAKLAEADDRLLHLTTSKAAELVSCIVHSFDVHGVVST